MLSFSLQKDFCKREMFFVDRERCPKDEYTQRASFETGVGKSCMLRRYIDGKFPQGDVVSTMGIDRVRTIYIFLKTSRPHF